MNVVWHYYIFYYFYFFVYTVYFIYLFLYIFTIFLYFYFRDVEDLCPLGTPSPTPFISDKYGVLSFVHIVMKYNPFRE